MKKGLLSLLLMIGLLPSVVFADMSTDKSIEQGLIGSWTVPMDATDTDDKAFLSLGHNAVEQYKSDHTGIGVGYKDQTCTNAFGSIHFTWKVIDRVLVTAYPDGHEDHDEIESIDSKSFIFHPMNSTRTPRRVRANCGSANTTP